MAAEPTARSKVIIVSSVSCLLALNLVVFATAYPETMRVDAGCCGNRPLAKDFSAFFTAAWRLLHDPSQVYTAGYVDDGEYHVLPQPEAYKYLPSFLYVAIPFLVLPYQDALTAFDVIQFLLLPLMAFLVYELTKTKGTGWVVAVAVVALLLPLPASGGGLSAPYYFQWAEGQSKVLVTFLLLLSFYLGAAGRPVLSGVVFGLAAFDPRFVLVGIPLFLLHNRRSWRVSACAGLATVLAANAVLLYPPLGRGFLGMLASGNAITPFYFYSLIPLLTVLVLTAVSTKEIAVALARRSVK